MEKGQTKIKKESLGPDEAWELLRASIKPLEGERIRVLQCWGRTLAEDVASPFDLPQEDRATRDGYALGPPKGKRKEFEVITPQILQERPFPVLGRGEAIRVRTGAPLPQGTWAVLPREEVEEDVSMGRVMIEKGLPERGSNLLRKGNLVKSGDILLGVGEVLGPGEVALLRSAGITHVRVSKRPRVAIIPTGSELTVPEASIKNPILGQSFVSHVWYLAWRVKEEGGAPKVLPPVPDVAQRIRRKLSSVFKDADLIVTTGGTGASELDLVGSTISDMGAEEIFRHPNMRPGKTISAFLLEGVPIICLPGAPGGVGLGCELLVVPAVRRLQGRRLESPRWVECLVAKSIPSDPKSYRFVEVALEIKKGLLFACPGGKSCSRRGISPLLGDGFLEVKPLRRNLEKGKLARVLLRGLAI